MIDDAVETRATFLPVSGSNQCSTQNAVRVSRQPLWESSAHPVECIEDRSAVAQCRQFSRSRLQPLPILARHLCAGSLEDLQDSAHLLYALAGFVHVGLERTRVTLGERVARTAELLPHDFPELVVDVLPLAQLEGHSL